MDFKTDLFSIDVPKKTGNLIGARLPSSLDIFYRSKHKELHEQYTTARIFMYETENENSEWDHWFKRMDDTRLQEMMQVKMKSTFFETALMFYNIVVDLSWTLCYVCCEFACSVDGARVLIEGMKPIEDSYKILRSAEKNVTSPTAEDNPFDYLKESAPEYSKAIDCIVNFWNNFSTTPIRHIYNFVKHRGKPVYKEFLNFNQPRFFGLYFQKSNDEKVQLTSDVRDVQFELSLNEEIQRLKEFDDDLLFPYIKNLLEIIEDIIKPSPYLVT